MKKYPEGTVAIFRLTAKGNPEGRPLQTFAMWDGQGRYQNPMQQAVGAAHAIVSAAYRESYDASLVIVGVRVRAAGKWVVSPERAWDHAAYVRFGQQWSW